MKNRKFRLFTIVCLCLCGYIFVAGTTIFTQKQSAKASVMAYVKKQCPEDFKLLSAVPVQDKSSDSIQYTFETAGRKLIFTATATYSKNSIKPSYISCDYKKTIRYLYAERIYEELLQCSCYSKSDGPVPFPDSPYISFRIGSYSDLEEAAATLDKCNQIYAEELAYNSQSFLEENSVSKVHIDLEMNNKTRFISRSIFTGAIDGNTEELLPTLGLAYAQIFRDHPDADPGDIPEKYMNMVHVSNLRMTLDEYCLEPDDFGYCWYNKNADTYMVGLFTNQSSLLVYDYLDLLDMDYTVDSDWTTICWESRDGKWELKRQQDKDGNLLREGMVLTKNGKTLSCLTESEDKDYDTIYTIVSVPAEDFARMFDLSYAIDEEKQEAVFTRIH